MLGKNSVHRCLFRIINENYDLIHISRKEEKTPAVQQRRQFANRRRLGRTSSCGILLNPRFDMPSSFI